MTCEVQRYHSKASLPIPCTRGAFQRNLHFVRQHKIQSGSPQSYSPPSPPTGFQSPDSGFLKGKNVRKKRRRRKVNSRPPSPTIPSSSPSEGVSGLRKSNSNDCVVAATADIFAEHYIKGNARITEVPAEVVDIIFHSLIPRTSLDNKKVTSLVFEGLKVTPTNDTFLRTFLRKMPKGELHTHATGAVDAECYIDFAKRSNLHIDPKTRLFHRIEPGEDPKGKISAKEVYSYSLKHAELRKEIMESINMTGCRKKEHSGADHFFKTFDIIGSITRYMPLDILMIYIVQAALLENKVYEELMYEPDLYEFLPQLPKKFVENMAKAEGASSKEEREKYYLKSLRVLQCSSWLNEYVSTHSRKLRDAFTEVARDVFGWDVKSLADMNSPVVIKVLIEVMRIDDKKDILCEGAPLSPITKFFAAFAAASALHVLAPYLVVGINRVGPEHEDESRELFGIQNEIIRFLKDAMAPKDELGNILHHIRFADHAGELSAEMATQSVLDTRVRESAKLCNRIGHGNSIVLERDSTDTIRTLKRDNICVEVCLASNENILKTNDKTHLVHFLRKVGAPFCLNSDDAAITRQTLTDQFHRFVKSASDVYYRSIENLVTTVGEYSFLHGESIYASKEFVLKPEFAKVLETGKIDDLIRARIANSERAQLQLKFAYQMKMFEKGISREVEIGEMSSEKWQELVSKYSNPT